MTVYGQASVLLEAINVKRSGVVEDCCAYCGRLRRGWTFEDSKWRQEIWRDAIGMPA